MEHNTLKQVGNKVINAIRESATKILAPESLSLQPSTENIPDARQSTYGTKPGDIILSRTPGALYTQLRTFTGVIYDHAVVVVENNKAVHISPPQARLIPLDVVLVSTRQPLVLRPQLQQDVLKLFVKQMTDKLGTSYATDRLFSLMLRLVFHYNFYNLLPRLQPQFRTSHSPWICTDAIVESLINSSATCQQVIQQLEPPLDLSVYGIASLRDIRRLEKESSILQKIPTHTSPITEAWFEEHGGEGVFVIDNGLPSEAESLPSSYFSRFGMAGRFTNVLWNMRNWLLSDLDQMKLQQLGWDILTFIQTLANKVIPHSMEDIWDGVQQNPAYKESFRLLGYLIGFYLLFKKSQLIIKALKRTLQVLIARKLFQQAMSHYGKSVSKL